MRPGRCEGYEWPCGDPVVWIVLGTEDRDEYSACDNCALDAIVFAGATAEDDLGNRLVIPR